MPPDDVDALRWTLLALVDDESARARLAATARGRALDLSPERMASAYVDAYARAARRADAPPAGGSSREVIACAS